MDKRYVARNVPLTQDKLDIVDAYRAELERILGFKVSLSDAIVHAVKHAPSLSDEAKSQ